MKLRWYNYYRIVCVVIAMAAVIVFLAACDKPPTQGNVIDKQFTAAHWEGGWDTMYRPAYRCHTVSQYDYNSKTYRTTEQCGTEMESYQVWDDHDYFVNDRWRLKVEDCITKDNGDSKCKRGWLTVGEVTYNHYRLGQHYPDAR